MIPKTQESDDQQKIRVMQDKIDALESQLAECGQSRAQQDARIPVPVLTALNWTSHYQQHSQPMIASCYDSIEVVERVFLDSEILAVEAAYDLVREYFDQNNPRYMAAYRKEAMKAAKAAAGE